MSNWKDIQLRGFVRKISEDQELVRGDHVRGGYYFLTVEYYSINNNKAKGTAKVYISVDNLGLGSRDGIIYYPSDDPTKKNDEFLTAIADPKRKFMNQRVGIIGKMRKDKEDDRYDIFVSHLTKVKIFPDPETYLKKK